MQTSNNELDGSLPAGIRSQSLPVACFQGHLAVEQQLLTATE
jgi:hypothetical protein